MRHLALLFEEINQGVGVIFFGSRDLEGLECLLEGLIILLTLGFRQEIGDNRGDALNLGT